MCCSRARGWTDEQWAATATSLVQRGLLTTDNTITPSGKRLVADVEAATDRIAALPWGDDALDIASALLPISRAAMDELPTQAPIGVLKLWDPVADPFNRAVVETEAG